MRTPEHGYTKSGKPLHRRTIDHHRSDTRVARFNKTLALWTTEAVGTMWAAYVFAVLAVVSLPAAVATGSTIVIVSWVAQTFLQLVLLAVILTGQRLQNAAADARTEKTFEDVETVRKDLLTALDRLDESTAGGLKTVLDAVHALQKPTHRR